MPIGNEYDPNEEVVVLRQHIQEVLAALSWAHSRESAFDLYEAYRQGKQTPTKSKLTLLIERAYNRIEGYLNDESDILPTE